MIAGGILPGNVDDPDGTGLSEDFHISPPCIGDGEVPIRYSLGGSYAEIGLRERMAPPRSSYTPAA
jgi:hypothetical protein